MMGTLRFAHPTQLTVGLDAFLDLLDENDHPPIFDPSRRSYV
jgi:hypothetical protein